MDSFIKWIGGKKLLRDKIIEQFPKDFSRYIEVFGGAGWVLFRKDQHAKFEVYNDRDNNLVNLYRCIKFHLEELQKELDLTVHSRELFFDYKEQVETRGLTDIQRAARYFLLIRESFGAKKSSFATQPTSLNKYVEYLSEISKRLNSVVIENLDFEHLIKTYDRTDALFYLDPPYVDTEKYYVGSFTKEDHERLCNTLKNIKGKFVLSYNDCEYVRKLYNDFNIIEVSRFNNLSNKNNSFNELIIKNY